MLLGTHRFRILEEIPTDADRSYRLARVETLEDHFDPNQSDVLGALRVEVVELLEILVRRADPKGRARFDPRRLSGIDDPTFVNVMSQLFDGAAAEKQGLIEADDLVERCRRLVAVLRFRVAEGGGSPASDALQ